MEHKKNCLMQTVKGSYFLNGIIHPVSLGKKTCVIIMLEKHLAILLLVTYIH